MLFGTKGVRILLYWLLLFPFSSLLWCKTSDKVSLSWRRNGNHLCFVCDVQNLSLGVSFEDPHGNTRGHCTAPIPHTVPGHCDSHLKQNIYNETTVLTIDRVDCENGLWKCSHGENTNEYATTSVSVSVDSTKQKPGGSKEHVTVSIYQGYICTSIPLWIGYAASHIMILIYSFYKERQNVTGQHHVNVCCKNVLTREIKLTRLQSVIPFAIFLILPLLLMNIPGICKGKWCILVGLVGVIIAGGFKLLQDKCCKDKKENSTSAENIVESEDTEDPENNFV
ncbi:uncharacterized protein LOC127702535 [Mytilus californianus]|uniref:uncharacterized protein LOC127702535 n=1 Tax=Mytilus californianus TaxID=6549 RepID=UPI0022484994|nr:uncharacterized protein LOC127702535 [Mytilus californianus]